MPKQAEQDAERRKKKQADDRREKSG